MKFVILFFISFKLFAFLNNDIYKAQKFYEDKNFEEAFKHYQKSLSKKNDDPKIYFNTGQSLYNLNKFKEAIEMFNIVKDKTKDLTLQERADFNIANSFFKSGLLEDAINKYKEILRKNPKHLGAKNNLDLALKRLEELKKQAEKTKEDLNKEQNKEQKNNQNNNKNSSKDKNKQDNNKKDNSDNNQQDQNKTTTDKNQQNDQNKEQDNKEQGGEEDKNKNEDSKDKELKPSEFKDTDKMTKDEALSILNDYQEPKNLKRYLNLKDEKEYIIKDEKDW